MLYSYYDIWENTMDRLVQNQFYISFKKNFLTIILYTAIAVLVSEIVIYLQISIFFPDMENKEIFYTFGFYTPIPVALILLSLVLLIL